MSFDPKDLELILDKIPVLQRTEAPKKTEPEQVKVESVGLSASFTLEAMKNSLDFLAGFLMPDVFIYFFPKIFKQIWALLTEKVQLLADFTKIVIGLPRGLGKTTLIKLFIIYIIFFTDRHFICIYGSREGLAENTLSDIKDFLDIINVKNLFGDWRMGIGTDSKQLLTFGFRGRDIVIAALGAGTSMRGMNLKNRRPDVMIFDDIQTDKCAQSEPESAALERWMVGTAMKAKDNFRCLYIYIGNMYPEDRCIMKKLKHNPEWISFIAGGILADGTSIWEEVKPLESMMSEFRSDIAMGHPEIFFAEVLNDEDAGKRSGIDVTKIPECPFTDDIDIPEGKCIIIDPSGMNIKGINGAKKSSDNTEIGLIEIYDHKPVLKEFISGIMSPGDTIRNALKLAFAHSVPIIIVEAAAYQGTLLYWFNFISEQMGLEGMQFAPITHQSRSKNSRIEVMFKQLLAGEVFLHQAIRSQVIAEVLGYNKKKTDNIDNKLDVCAYAHPAMELYYWDMMMPMSVDAAVFEESKVYTLAENCHF